MRFKEKMSPCLSTPTLLKDNLTSQHPGILWGIQQYQYKTKEFLPIIVEASSTNYYYCYSNFDGIQWEYEL